MAIQQKIQESISDQISSDFSCYIIKGWSLNSNWLNIYTKSLLCQPWDSSTIFNSQVCGVNNEIVQDSKDQMLIDLVQTMNHVRTLHTKDQL